MLRTNIPLFLAEKRITNRKGSRDVCHLKQTVCDFMWIIGRKQNFQMRLLPSLASGSLRTNVITLAFSLQEGNVPCPKRTWTLAASCPGSPVLTGAAAMSCGLCVEELTVPSWRRD